MRRSRIISASILIGAAIGGWTAGLELTRDTNEQLISAPVMWTDSLYDVHTVRLRGNVSAAARSRVDRIVETGPAILVVLDSVDLRRCGDLGRQIRELHRAVAGRIPLLIAPGSTGREEVEWFLKSERLMLEIVDAVGAENLLEAGSTMPTPAAVWLDPDLSYGIGVGHLPRYPYIRKRSFAEELAQLYGGSG